MNQCFFQNLHDIKFAHLRLWIIRCLGNGVNAVLVELRQGVRENLKETDSSRRIERSVLRVHREREPGEFLSVIVVVLTGTGRTFQNK